MSGRATDWGVVALAMGSPTSPAEVEPFLERMFSDPAILRAPLGPLRGPLARTIARRRAPGARHKYGLIGGSPLAEETRKQTDALATALEPDGVPVTHAMTYTKPSSADALAELSRHGVRRVLALPLFPQRSETTTGAGLRELRSAADQGLEITEAPPYPTLAGFVEPLAEATRVAVRETQSAGHETAVLLTAHGLPERYVKAGDPYVTQVEQTAAALQRSADVECDVALGYQSRLGPVRWVGPQVEDEAARLAAAGCKGLVVVPITFVTEHLETRYDLDLDLKAHAWSLGIQDYRRIPAIGSHPDFIAGLADHVRAQI